MDGLELCRKVRSQNVKKILVTGVADEKTAVKAFNANEIDAFVMKGSNDAIEQIVEFTRRLQVRFFQDEQSTLWETIVASERSFLADEKVADIMSALLSGRYREYYLLASLGGYLLVTNDGSLHWALIQDHQQSLQVERFAKSLGAPQSVLEKLQSRQYLAYLPDNFSDLHSGVRVSWESHLVKATQIDGTVPWLFGIHENPPIELDMA